MSLTYIRPEGSESETGGGPGEGEQPTLFETKQKWVERMQDFRKSLGPATWYSILGTHGYEDPDEVQDRETMKAIYNDMAEAYGEKVKEQEAEGSK